MIGISSVRIGLNLGTANTLLYVKGRRFVINETSLVSVHAGTGDIEAAGKEAEAGLGRTTRKFRTARPVLAWIINDLNLCEGMLQPFLAKARITGPLRRVKVAMAVPSGMTEVGMGLTLVSSRYRHTSQTN